MASYQYGTPMNASGFWVSQSSWHCVQLWPECPVCVLFVHFLQVTTQWSSLTPTCKWRFHHQSLVIWSLGSSRYSHLGGGRGFPVGSDGKESACYCGRPGFDPWGGEDPLEKGMATHSRILAWRTPWTEEPDGPQSLNSQGWTGNEMQGRWGGGLVAKSCPTLVPHGL